MADSVPDEWERSRAGIDSRRDPPAVRRCGTPTIPAHRQVYPPRTPIDARIMTDIESTTVNEAGFSATSQTGDFNIETHALGESGPSPNAVLLSDYAACFTYAFRAGADRADYDDLGKIQTDAEADLDDDDDLTTIRFTMHVEADLTDDDIDELLPMAEDICHVHAALKESLYADVTVHGDAF